MLAQRLLGAAVRMCSIWTFVYVIVAGLTSSQALLPALQVRCC